MSRVFKKIIITASIYLVIFIAVIVFALNPSINSLKQNKQKVVSNQNKLDQTYLKLNTLQKIEKHPEEFKAARGMVNNSWPDNLDISHFIVQTENLAKNNSIILENLSVAEIKKSSVKSAPKEDGGSEKATTEKKKDAETGTQFTFGLQAPYSSVLSFIKGMETLPRFNSISLINLSGDDTGIINLRMTGSIYYGK